MIFTKKLSESQVKEVVTDFASGKSKSDIARKFNVSVTAISKILNNFKVKNEFNQVKNKPNREYAKDIISKAYNALYNSNYEKLHPETLIKIIERLTTVYKDTFDDNQDTNVNNVNVTFEDASIDIQENNNNNSNNN